MFPDKLLCYLDASHTIHDIPAQKCIVCWLPDSFSSDQSSLLLHSNKVLHKRHNFTPWKSSQKARCCSSFTEVCNIISNGLHWEGFDQAHSLLSNLTQCV